MFLCGFSPIREFFPHLETLLLPVKGYTFSTYTRHSWPLRFSSSLTSHIHSDKGQPFIHAMVISEDPWKSQLLPSFWQWSCYYLFILRFVPTGNQTRPSSCYPRGVYEWKWVWVPDKFTFLFCKTKDGDRLCKIQWIRRETLIPQIS